MARFVTSDGLSLYYSDEGPREGKPILCLAGLTRASTDFDYVAPHLSHARVIRMDYRGRGQSDWSKAKDYSVMVEARDALECLDHLEVERAAILGTSRGGLIALGLAATAKDRLTGVCFNDVGPVLSDTGLDEIAAFIGRDPQVSTLREAADGLKTKLAGFDNVPSGRWYEDASRFFKQSSKGLKITYDPALRDSFLAARTGGAIDLWPLFDAMSDLPLALIRGQNSTLLSIETAREMQARRPDLIFADVPDRGHVPWLDEPDALAALNSWIEQLT